MIRAFLLALACMLTAPARAADHPPAVPTRDVDVLYDLPTRAGLAKQRLRYSAARQVFRIDPPGQGLFVIIDQPRGRMYTVREDNRTIIEMASPRSWMHGITGGRFERRGADTVAGLACTDWATTDSERRTVLVCLTADGVMLRARTVNGAPLITAATVRYLPQPDGVFMVPAGFRRLAPPPIAQAR